MRIIPKQTRVRMEFFKNIDLPDAIIGLTGIAITVFLFTSNLPGRYWGMLGVVIFFGLMFIKMDDARNYMLVMHLLKHFTIRRKFKIDGKKGRRTSDIASFTGVKDGFIEFGGEYFGQAIAVPSVEFRFFSEMRQDQAPIILISKRFGLYVFTAVDRT